MVGCFIYLFFFYFKQWDRIRKNKRNSLKKKLLFTGFLLIFKFILLIFYKANFIESNDILKKRESIPNRLIYIEFFSLNSIENSEHNFSKMSEL